MLVVSLSAGSASASTTTVGEVALTPIGGLSQTTGQNIPVFQGDASGNYTLSSPQTGTITSWSFLSAGIPTGKHFVLRVLAPVGTGGTQWKGVATSKEVAITSTTGVDELNGPFATELPIAAGDRIALQPVDDSSTPIESGLLGMDGFRFFAKQFADGETATQVTSEDNGQVVPVQATVQYGPTPPPPPPPALASLTPPVVALGTTPVSHARDKEVLTCLPGTYNDSPTTHAFYWFWTETTYVPTGVKGVLHAEVSQTGLDVSGQTVTLPDLPAFGAPTRPGQDSSTISCEDTASFNAETLSSQSAQVRVLPLVPTLATHTIPRPRSKPVTVPIKPPSITAGVGAGGTNQCNAGKWEHFPTSFNYAWREIVGTSTRLLHIGQHFKLTTAQEGERIECSVQGVNAAGASKRMASNRYIVPASAPRSTGAPVVTLSTEDPQSGPEDVSGSTHARLPGATSNEWAYYTAIAEKVYLSCDTGTWNRGDLGFTTRWFVNGQAIDITGDTIGNHYVSISEPYSLTETVPGAALRFNFTPDNTQEPTLFNGVVTCIVTATTPQGLHSDSSSLPLRIWNGCDVGIEPWDKKILLDGPLCSDYEPYYNNS